MFTINNEIWNVQYVAANHPALMRAMTGQFTLGCCDDKLKTIFINDTLDGALLKKVLCHEITHAAMFSYDVDLTYEQEELVADLIATYGDEIIFITNKIFNRLREGY